MEMSKQSFSLTRGIVKTDTKLDRDGVSNSFFLTVKGHAIKVKQGEDRNVLLTLIFNHRTLQHFIRRLKKFEEKEIEEPLEIQTKKKEEMEYEHTKRKMLSECL